jgi:hypothetical protein
MKITFCAISQSYVFIHSHHGQVKTPTASAHHFVGPLKSHLPSGFQFIICSETRSSCNLPQCSIDWFLYPVSLQVAGKDLEHFGSEALTATNVNSSAVQYVIHVSEDFTVSIFRVKTKQTTSNNQAANTTLFTYETLIFFAQFLDIEVECLLATRFLLHPCLDDSLTLKMEAERSSKPHSTRAHMTLHRLVYYCTPRSCLQKYNF